MAIIKLSQLVSDIRGKAGGNVFSRNKGGAYVRTYVKPTNPQTVAQSIVRARFQALTQEWRNLTDTQRTGWNSATVNFPYQDSLGNTKIYSGEQLFIKLNLNLLSSGAGISNTTPIAETVADPGLTAVGTLTSLSIILTFTEATVPAGAAYNIYATPPVSPGISNVPASKYRLIHTVAAAGDPEGDLITQYSAVFGPPIAAQKVHFSVVNIDQSHGQASAEVQAVKVAS